MSEYVTIACFCRQLKQPAVHRKILVVWILNIVKWMDHIVDLRLPAASAAGSLKATLNLGWRLWGMGHQWTPSPTPHAARHY